MMQASGERPQGTHERTYSTELRCPACSELSPQLLLRARQIVPIPLPDKRFHRAFCWTQGRPTLGDSPLYHGVLLCPECRFPGLEWDFQPTSDLPPPNTRILNKLFVKEKAGRSGLVSELLTEDPSSLPQPEKTLRILFASARAEMLAYPELWRKEILGQLSQRVAWIYFDLLHLDWSEGDLTGPPSYKKQGPNAEVLKHTIRLFDPTKEKWPQIPLDETQAFTEALNWFELNYQTRGQQLTAEPLAREELRLARLYGLLTKMEIARDLYDRARETAFIGRGDAVRRHDEALSGRSGEAADWRTLALEAKRLGLLVDEIYSERVSIFGAPMDRQSSGRMGKRVA